MSAEATIPNCVVRPPWPDEMPRIAEAFPDFVHAQAMSPVVLVATAGGIERIVGVACVTDTVNGIAGLAVSLRSRFMNPTGVRPLVDAALVIARGTSATQLVTIDDLRSGDARLAALGEQGFKFKRRMEYWSTDLATYATKLDRVRARWRAPGSAEGFCALPLTDEHLRAVRDWPGAKRLWEGRELALAAEPGAPGLDSGLSFGVVSEGILAGALLARASRKETVLVEAVALARRRRAGTGSVRFALFVALVESATKAGAKQIVFAVEALHPAGPRRMAAGTGSRLVAEFTQLGTRIV